MNLEPKPAFAEGVIPEESKNPPIAAEKPEEAVIPLSIPSPHSPRLHDIVRGRTGKVSHEFFEDHVKENKGPSFDNPLIQKAELTDAKNNPSGSWRSNTSFFERVLLQTTDELIVGYHLAYARVVFIIILLIALLVGYLMGAHSMAENLPPSPASSSEIQT